MTPKIPLRLCKKCPLYHGNCPLQDLDPCIMTKDRQEEGAVARIVVFVLLVAVAAVILFLSCQRDQAETSVDQVGTKLESSRDQVGTKSVVELLRQQHHELSEWEELQMAIIWTESHFNTNAVGAAGDRGAMQIVPIYIDEVNRLAGTSYVPTDAFDITKSLEMFEIIQGVYNPTHDRDLAIYYHNKGSSYRAEVLKNLELVHRYEVVRRAVKK